MNVHIEILLCTFVAMRYKEYNPNQVLEKAIRLHWEKGVNGSSINDLVELTGVNRFSLYNEFGNKQGILYDSIKLYRERYCQPKMEILNQEGNVREILLQFFLSFLADDLPVSGCYIIHIGTELADSDERVKRELDDYLKMVRVAIKNLLLKNGYDQVFT